MTNQHLTPGDILCLMEYLIYPDGSSDITNRNSSAVQKLLDLHMISDEPDDNQFFTITGKGKAHCDHLMALRLPVRRWLLPSDGDRQ